MAERGGDGTAEWCCAGGRALYTDKRSLVSSLCTINDVGEEFCEITLLNSVNGRSDGEKETETVRLSPTTPDPAGKTVVFDFDQTLTEVGATTTPIKKHGAPHFN